MRESHIEKKASQWARDHGWKVRKMASPGQRAALDRIFHKQGVTAYIEFKRPGGKPTELQKIEMEELTNQWIPNACVDSVEAAVEFLNNCDPTKP